MQRCECDLLQRIQGYQSGKDGRNLTEVVSGEQAAMICCYDRSIT
jgi:hypothetical protein